ncbi:zinc finger protein 91-like isoform X1 [Pararge aegeria]|uniref:zinc finger protein 91-like isoform X1 n=1 Tax=Pararge aegeria TaxID=116150 RepID=UPI0019D09E7A|nr:zinc finger protein 91-like isoform X1 [Pararge aegeria]
MEGVLSDGMCRCCATEGTFKDFQVPYQWMGVEEIYANMLKDCFDITLSISEEINNGGVCEVCITQLRNACNFKQQVQKTEEKFKKKIEEGTFKADSIKMEVTRFDDDDSNLSADDFSSQEYEVPIKVEKVEDRPKKRQAASKASTSKAKKAKTSVGEPSAKRNTRAYTKMKRAQSDLSDFKKNEHNLKIILRHSNSNLIRNKVSGGYGCQFCTEAHPQAKNLKEHNLQKHKIREIVKSLDSKPLKFVMKLDITNLKCTICDKSLAKLDEFIDHVKAEHNKEVYKDIKSVIIPFKFDTNKQVCVECRKEFPSFKTLLEHMNVHYNNYICPVCGKGFVAELQYEKHSKMHTTEIFQCNDCDKVFAVKDSLRKHLQRLHKRATKKKDSAQSRAKKPVNLSETKKNQHNLRTILLYSNSNLIKNKTVLGYCCQFCPEYFPEPKLLKEHFLREHRLKELVRGITRNLFDFAVKLDITDLKCTVCNKNLDTLRDFFDHIKAAHDIGVYRKLKSAIVSFKFDTEKLTCIECFKEFPNFKRLLQHMNVHFSNFICPICGKAFLTANLNKHHVRRHKTEEFTCKYCDKVYGNQEKLTNHQRRVHLGFYKRNKCGVCDERFEDYAHKVNHMVEAHGAPVVLLKCHLCDMSYTDQRRLTTHIKKDHNLERKYECDQCDLDFYSSSTLKRHMVKHTGARIYKCDVCLKSYGTQNILREHKRSHADDRRFKCDQCDKAFVQNSTLKNHKRAMHGAPSTRVRATRSSKKKNVSSMQDEDEQIQEKILEDDSSDMDGEIQEEILENETNIYHEQQVSSDIDEEMQEEMLENENNIYHEQRVSSDMAGEIQEEILENENNIYHEQQVSLDMDGEIQEEILENENNIYHEQQVSSDMAGEIQAETLENSETDLSKTKMSSDMDKNIKETILENKKKNHHNLKMILLYSNSSIIKYKDGIGYSCQFCTKYFPEAKHLKEHFLLEHKILDIIKLARYTTLFNLMIKVDITDLKCTLCNQSLDKLEDFLDHINADHHIEVHKNFKTVIAPFKFDTDKFVCVECCKEVRNFNILVHHMQTHFNNCVCAVCGRGFVSDRMFMQHLKSHDPQDFKCDVCQKAFTTKDKLRVHLGRVHGFGGMSNKTKFFRPMPRKEKKLRQNLSENKKDLHNITIILLYSNSNLIRNKDDLGYSCQFCTKQYPTPKNLKDHFLKEHFVLDVVEHINAKLFDAMIKVDITDLQCTLCDTNLNELEDFVEHIKADHNIEFYRDFNSGIVPFRFDTDKLLCVLCSKEFPKFKNLVEHMNQHYDNCICEVCGKGFVTGRLHAQHVRRHKTNQLTCYICDKVLRTKGTLRAHVKNVHYGLRAPRKKKKQIDTELCQKLPVNKKDNHNLIKILSYSNSNLIRNKDDRGYGCEFCTKQFSEASILKKHCLKKHKVSEIIKFLNKKSFENTMKLDITDLKCTHCDLNVSKLEHFIDHIKAEHNVEVYNNYKTKIVPFKFDTDKFLCVECCKEFTNFKLLLEHMQVHFKNYECSVCGKGFITSRLFTRHARRHMAKELKCEICDKVFGDKEKLGNHLRTVHLGKNKRNKCNICNERFAYHSHKLRHMVKAHGAPELKLKCHLCDRVYKYQKRLTVHIKHDHHLVRNFKCNLCELSFVDSAKLKMHMTKHTGVREYQCDVCLKSYRRKDTLVEHMKIHENDRRFVCDYCGQSFVQKCSLRNHIQIQHGISI